MRRSPLSKNSSKAFWRDLWPNLAERGDTDASEEAALHELTEVVPHVLPALAGPGLALVGVVPREALERGEISASIVQSFLSVTDREIASRNGKSAHHPVYKW